MVKNILCNCILCYMVYFGNLYFLKCPPNAGIVHAYSKNNYCYIKINRKEMLIHLQKEAAWHAVSHATL